MTGRKINTEETVNNEDLRLLTMALARTVNDDGKRHSLNDVATEFGIDPADLDEDCNPRPRIRAPRSSG